jgi:DNA-binding NtrC family response regulator
VIIVFNKIAALARRPRTGTPRDGHATLQVALVVDVDVETRSFILNALADAGVAVTVVSTPAMALQVLRRVRVDAVFVGATVAEDMILAFRDHPRQRVIEVAKHYEAVMRADFFDAYLLTPCAAEDVVHAMRDMVTSFFGHIGWRD